MPKKGSDGAAEGKGESDAASFPDLHHKMSKKIAQLTKVIYHLNTRNDDHTAEVKALAAQHESEIDGILKDASGKIAKFQEQLSRQRDSVKQSMTVAKLKAQHEEEKKNALAQFADYKRSAQAETSKLQRQHAEEIKVMRKELERAKDGFKARVEAFTEATARLQANTTVSSQELDAMRLAHQDEVDGLVKKYNTKYNEMLRQRMDEEDKMRAELERQNKEACEELSRKFEARIKAMKAEFEEALQQARGGADENMARIREEHHATMQRLLKDLEALRTSEEASKSLAGELQSRVNELEANLARTQRDLESKAKALEALERNARDGSEQQGRALAEAQRRISELEDSNGSLTYDLNSTKTRLDTESKRAEALEAQLAAEKEARRRAESDGAAATGDLQSALADAEAETKSLQRRVAELDLVVSQRDKELEDAKKAADDAAASNRKTVDRLNGEIADLKSRVQKLQGDSSSAGAAAKDREEALKKSLKAAKEDGHAALEAAKQAHKKALAEAEAGAAAASKSAAAARAEAVAKEKTKWEKKLKAREAELIAERDAMRDQMLKEAEDALAKYRAEVGDELEATRAKMERMTLESDRLKKEIVAKASTQGKALKEAEEDVVRLEKEVEQLEDKLSAAREGEARSARMVESLKKQVEELRLEIQDVGKEAARKLTRELAETEAKWSKRLEEETGALKAASEAEKRAAVAKVTKEYEDLLKATAGDAAAKLKAVTKELIQLKETLERTKENASKAAKAAAEELRAVHDKARKQLQEAVANGEARERAAVKEGEAAVKRKQETMAAERERALSELRAANDAALAGLRDEHSQNVKRLNAEHRDNMAAQEDMLNQQAEESREALRRKHASEVEALKQRLADERAAAEAEVAERHHAEVADVSERLRTTSEQLAAQTDRGDKLQASLNDTRQQLQQERDTIVRLKQEHEYAMQQLNDSLNKKHKEELDGMMDEHMRETQAFNEQFQQAQAMWEDQKSVLNQRLAELEERFRNRESRPEDVLRIKKLAELCAEKDALVKKTLEEMKYFKLELMNREENFNSKFNRTPTVGVMQVVKTKGGAAAGGATAPGLPPLPQTGSAMNVAPGGTGASLGGAPPKRATSMRATPP